MALFEGETLDESETVVGDSNRYLDNSDEGFRLIQKILSSSSLGEDDEVTEFISHDIFPIIAELKLDDELEIYRKLSVIGSKLQEQQRVKLLKGKKILGVGGKFSAGKSCFINSITNAELPEGQRPTTSIATYIVNADSRKNIALTKKSVYVDLDDEALEALTHRFFEKYKIGFSKLIQQLIVYTPDFTYPNIAILDTPGYSKSDVNKGEDSTDAQMARIQLQSIDYLVWLIDSVQGVITQRDLEFLATLNVDTPILFVFTKASLETDENLKKKIKQAKEMLKKCNKEVYDVIAYDSVTKETVIGEGVLEQFLTMINEDNSLEESFDSLIRSIGERLIMQIDNQVEFEKDQINQLDELFFNLYKVEHINSLLDNCLIQNAELNQLTINRRKIVQNFDRLVQILNLKDGRISG